MRTRLWQAVAGILVAALVGVLAPQTAHAAPATQAAGPAYRIFNTEGRCLDGGNPNGLYIWRCINAATNQRWYFDFIPGSSYAYIRNQRTQRCIRSTGHDGPVITGACDGAPETMWFGHHRDSNWYWLTPRSDYFSGCINGPSSGDGSGLFLNFCTAPRWPTNAWSWHVI